MAAKQFNGLVIKQNNNMYEVYLPQGIKVLSICMPCDGQFVQDVVVNLFCNTYG